MSGVHLIILKNKIFDDIPKSEFYFDDYDNLLEALDRLQDFDFEINMFLDLDSLSEEELEELLSKNKKYKRVFLDKEKKMEYYKKNIEVII